MDVDAQYRPLVTARPAWPDRRFLDRVGTSIPIVQAPMAGSGGVDLAVAAIAGGALGSLPCALIAPDQIVAQTTAVRAAVTGPINLNFFCHQLADAVDESGWRAALADYYHEYDVGPPAVPPPLRAPFDETLCTVVEQLRPEVISFHFGLPPQPLLDRVRATGAVILSSATSVAEARWLAVQGVDAVIAQGWEAGGHAGRFLDGAPAAHMGLMALLPQIVDAIDIPVIAAGGIADARGIVAACALGASAVQIGTAYLRTPESLISPMHRAALASIETEDTRFTNLMTGGLARGIPNRLMRARGDVNPVAPPFPYASAALSTLRTAAEALGRTDFSSLWSGQAARLGAELPARALTEKLADEALALLAALSGRPTEESAL